MLRIRVLQDAQKRPGLTATLLHPEHPIVTPGQPKPETKRKGAAVSGTLGISALRTSKELKVAHPVGDSHPPAKRSRLSRISRKAA